MIILQNAPVWEIIGAEFTHSETHTAGGISIRFPRVTRFRDDKDFETGHRSAKAQGGYLKEVKFKNMSEVIYI